MSQLSKIPAIGERVRTYQLARLYRTIGMLLNGGIPAVTAIDMSMGLLDPQLKSKLTQARREIAEGRSISQSMERYGLTTSIASRMLAVGERSGKMGDMMEQIARFHDDEIALWIDRFSRTFEPLMMLMIGIVIGCIVVLMYMPIFELAGNLQ